MLDPLRSDPPNEPVKYTSITPSSLQNNDQNDQYQNQNADAHAAPIFLAPLVDSIQLSLRPVQPPLVPVHVPFHIIKQLYLIIQLVTDLYTEIPLPSDAFP